MVNNNFVKMFLSVFLLAIVPTFANAVVITLEPDDYGLGVPLENEYVKVTSSDGSPYDTPWSQKPAITAENSSEWEADYKAPTGDLTFGNFRFNEYDLSGLVLVFNQAVSRVTMLANSGYKEQWYQHAGWAAYDRDGNQITRGGKGLREGFSDETFEIDIKHEDIWAVRMGGSEGIPYIFFDHLTFELPDASVPAPNPFVLLIMGLAVIMLRASLRMKLGWTPKRK